MDKAQSDHPTSPAQGTVTVTPLRGPLPEGIALTYPRFASLVMTADDHLKGLRLGAVARESSGCVVGLALAWRPQNAKGPWLRLMSVFVARDWRRRGIARQMLRTVTAEASAAGTDTIVAFHGSRQPNREGYEALMTSAGWQGPDVHQWRLTGRVGWAVQPDAALERARAHVSRHGYRLSFLADDGCAGFAAMDGLIAAGRIEATFAPQPDRSSYDPEATCLILSGDTVVGWILGCPLPGPEGPGCLYPEATVLPELRRTGWLPVALQDVCRRQAARFGTDSQASYTTGRPEMLAFIRRRLIERHPDWVVDHDHRCRFWLALNSTTGSDPAAQ